MSEEELFEELKKQYMISLSQLIDAVTISKYSDFQTSGAKPDSGSKRATVTLDWCLFWQEIRTIKAINQKNPVPADAADLRPGVSSKSD